MDKPGPPIDVHRRIVDFIDDGRSFAVTLVLKTDSSTPRKAGVKAIVDETGRIEGTLGGGAVENEARRRAAEACRSKRPALFDIRLDGARAEGETPICGGAMRILADPTAAKDRFAYSEAADARQRRERGVLLTRVRRPNSPEVAVQWLPEADISPSAPFPGVEAIRSCLAGETPQLFESDSAESAEGEQVFVEPLLPGPLLLIAGGGHIGQALALQACLVGFDIVVLDDRPEFADPALFPGGTVTRCGPVGRELAEFPIGPDAYVVIVTRGHRHDAEALEACIKSPAAYVGMIGSKRKVDMVRRHFVESGLATEEEFRRVFAPIGLDVGAETVPEIAASIVAQLIAVRRKGDNYTPPGDMTLR